MIEYIQDEEEFTFKYKGKVIQAYARHYDNNTFDVCIGTIEYGELDNVSEELRRLISFFV